MGELEAEKHVDFPDQATFEWLMPTRQRVPFIFNSPHSGTSYPKSFLQKSRLDHLAIRRSEDTFVDELFQNMVTEGAPLLKANFPRAYLDVNREPYELDPKMFDGSVPSYANTRSIRVAGGLGTIARIVSEGREIYAQRLPIEDALLRIETIYKPYHRALRRVLAKTHVEFGQSFLVDCHSMPSAPANSKANGATPRPDFVIGDRYGTSCSSRLTRLLVDGLSARGYQVVRNKPYAGGFVTEHYGRPARGLHAIQIEINRGLYMNEQSLEKLPQFDHIANDFTQAFTSIFALMNAQEVHDPLAAE